MLLSALLKGVGEISPSQDVEIENVTDKLSEVKNNSLFVCIDGDSFDGNDFVTEALLKGAAAVISEKQTKADISIKVPSSRKALALIASNFYGNPAKKLKIIGVTGTNGKTTTAFLVRHILEYSGKKCGLTGTVKKITGGKSVSSTLTTPESAELQKTFAEMLKNGCEYCVSEISSQALSQSRAEGVSFCAAAITNITPEHLNYHHNMENYISAKLLLFKSSDFSVINVDDKNIRENKSRISCRQFTVSLKDRIADYFAQNIVSTAHGVEFELLKDRIYKVCTPLPGIYNVYNALCAVAVCSELGIDTQICVDALRSFSGVEGRCEKVPTGCDFNVIIDYAHTPDGFQNIISSARAFTENRIITVFGCGGDRDKSKRAVMGKIASELSDAVIVTDDNPRTESPVRIICDILEGMSGTKCHYAVVSDRKDAIGLALKIAEKGDTVLILGKGHEKYQITANGKIPFDEKEIIQEFLKQDEKIWNSY
ncbi:MAG: UDP-N-acetylmuramoyl-L-alanyl-D-glutamate--2,6-diaminopimelate ligase [Oscillospiraceae bacterium]|nr:UDP-N-acetylmuramoyl-L-alanyl-D-glutamate--2,6-diaminopimelate ligase [Oscillospiraceae bacterium]